MADSVCEAEYITVSDTIKKAMQLRKFITELGVAPSIDGPILLYYDSTRAIAQTKDPKAHQWTKYILRRYHLAREIINRGDIDLQKIDEKDNLVDPLTKVLTVKEFEDHKMKIGRRYCTDWLQYK